MFVVSGERATLRNADKNGQRRDRMSDAERNEKEEGGLWDVVTMI
jgi:hypothetical protein